MAVGDGRTTIGSGAVATGVLPLTGITMLVGPTAETITAATDSSPNGMQMFTATFEAGTIAGDKR